MCLPNIQDWLDWMPMLCQSTFSCNASVNGSSIDTWTDRHAIICCIGNRLADWHSIGRMTLYWQFEVGLAKVAKCAIGTGLAPDWPIGTGLTDWHWIGTGLADWHRIGTGLADWHQIGKKLVNWHRIGRLATDWLEIGSRLAS